MSVTLYRSRCYIFRLKATQSHDERIGLRKGGIKAQVAVITEQQKSLLAHFFQLIKNVIDEWCNHSRFWFLCF